MTHYTLKITFYFPTIERFEKVILVPKFVAKVTHVILTAYLHVSEMALLTYQT